MKNNDWHLYDAYELGIENGNITFWTAMINEIIPPNTGKEIVLDYGCGDGGFLRLLNQMRPFSQGVGVDVDAEAIAEAKKGMLPGEPITYGLTDVVDVDVSKYDFIFCQEIFWTIDDVSSLASRFHRLLRDNGECYATMGCHIENPLWPHRRRLLQEEGYQVFDYSLDEIADKFYSEGFEVGLKRLPVDYFNIFHPDFTRNRAQSLSRLVQTTHENKMIFYFRKLPS